MQQSSSQTVNTVAARVYICLYTYTTVCYVCISVKVPLSDPQNQHFIYVICFIILYKTPCMYNSWEWASRHIAALRFVHGNMQLAEGARYLPSDDVNVRLQTKGFPEVQRTLAPQPRHLRFRYDTATKVTSDSARRVLSTHYISICRCSRFLPVAPVLLSWIGFVILPSHSSILINIVADHF